MTLLPPNARPLERAIETGFGQLADVPAPIRDQWNPATCAPALLPFLAFGVSIDFWDATWNEAEKRAAIAGAIDAQRRKGTPASLRDVLDRFDPLIDLVEWFEDKDRLAPHTFRLELPLRAASNVVYDEDLVTALLRDIAAVKPLRAHMIAVHKLTAQANGYLAAAFQVAGFSRASTFADLDLPAEPRWATYLQTTIGEPFVGPEGQIWEHA